MLPIEKVKASRKNPKRLIIFGKPKCGKTTAISQLEGCLILDFESGTEHVDALKMKVIGLKPPVTELPKQKEARLSKQVYYLTEIGDMIIQYRKDHKGEYPYKYVAIDTITEMENFCIEDATLNYMNTAIGKGFNKDTKGELLPKDKQENVTSLPNGAGWLPLRTNFANWLNYIDTLAPNIILIGHSKDKTINKLGKELTSLDLDLLGKLSSITAASSDAIGYISKKDDEVMINFASKDASCGARPKHLTGKEIILSEKQEDGSIKTFWESIYID
jgi:hypothetical protein